MKFITDHATSLQLCYTTHIEEYELLSHNDFYIELVVQKFTNEVREIRPFKSVKRLTPYLPQIDISEIVALLSW